MVEDRSWNLHRPATLCSRLEPSASQSNKRSARPLLVVSRRLFSASVRSDASCRLPLHYSESH